MEVSKDTEHKPKRLKMDAEFSMYLEMDEKDLQKICRVCLITEGKMYKIEGTLQEDLISVVDANNSSDLLPRYMCYECRWLIQKAVGFRLKCQQAQNIFLQLLNEYKVVTKETITNEHRKSIKSKLTPRTTGEDNIINITYNDEINKLITFKDDDVNSDDENKEIVVPKVESGDGSPKPGADNDVWLLLCEPNEEKDNDNGNGNNNDNGNDNDNHSDGEAYSPKSELDEESSEEIEQKKPKPIPKKRKRRKVIKKETKEKEVKKVQKKEEIRDKDGLKPEEADLKTHFNISFLTLKEQKAEIERRKETTNYIQSPYKCEVCYKGFYFEKTLTNHAAKHKPEWGAFACPVCGIRFPIARFLRTHLRTHERLYACTMCHYVTSHLDPAKRHKQYHTGVTYTCEHCGEVIKRKTSYLNHVRKKHPSSQFVCSQCGFSFVSEKGLKMHVTISHRNESNEPEKKTRTNEVGPASWECVECALTFKAEAAWRRHQATQHTTHSEAHLKLCRECGIRFPSGQELRSHNAAVHPEEVAARAFRARGQKFFTNYPLLCEQCGVEIPNRQKHWRHYQKFHFQLPYPIARNFICETCGKGYNNNAQLVYHRRTHFKERMFRCPQCPKAFYNGGNLSLHVRTHSSLRPYSCEHCGKGFKGKLGLTMHLTKVCPVNVADEKKELRKSNSPKAAAIVRKNKRKALPLRNM